MTIVAPEITYLQSGYPVNGPWYAGYESTYEWEIADSCGYPDGGIDVNEAFGSFTPDSTNNWTTSMPNGLYIPSYLVDDSIGHTGGTPAAEPPQTPLTTLKIRHDYPWALRVGSKTSGSGTPVRVDTQQWWLDHGTHY
ncbi:MAG TPA: hypothetical protein VFW83_03500 [Bryobacteraceae bacterium]|nr:hypothetical protein [Bryobacteraceae bacterium]